MSNGNGSDLLGIAWDVAKYVLSAIGFVLSGGGIWALRRYSGDRAMLLRHEELLQQDDQTMGELVAHRRAVEKGPFGEELEQEIKLLHRRAGVAKKLATDAKSEAEARFAAIEESLKWIKEALQRIEKK